MLYGSPRRTSVLMVISPLKSLMEDQVSSLGDLGIPAVAIRNETDVEVLQQVASSPLQKRERTGTSFLQ